MTSERKEAYSNILSQAEGRQRFNRCRRCRRWVSDAAYNATTLACVECSPWEEDYPLYCSQCGETASEGEIFCRACRCRLQYAFDFGSGKIDRTKTDQVLKYGNRDAREHVELADPEEFGFGIGVMKRIKVCRQCGRDESAQRDICSVCGKTLPSETLFELYRKKHERCTICDTVLALYMKYCPHCGTKVMEGK